MKKYFLILLVSLLAVTFCKKDEKNSNNELALLLLLANNKSAADQTSDITTPVGKATSVSSAISGISSSVTSSSNASSFTMKGKNRNPIEKNEMMAINSVLKYGKDSKIARNSILSLFKKQQELNKNQSSPSRGNKRLTAWSSSSTDADGFTSYTFSGKVKGYKYEKKEVDFTSFTSGATTCKATTYNAAFSTLSKTDQGTASFTDGIYKSKSTGTSTSSEGNTYLTKTSATVIFNSFGTLYGDLYKVIALLKKYSGSSVFTSSKPECSAFQAFIADFDAIYNQAILSGGVTYSTDSNSVVKLSGTTTSINSTFISTSNSTSAISISQNGQSVSDVTFKDLKFTGVSDYSSTSGKYTGKYTITITGTISGSPINETISVVF